MCGDTAGADETAGPIRRVVALDANDAAGAGCVHELACTNRHADVRGATADGLEEQQIAGLDLVEIHRRALVILLAHFARQHSAELREYVLDESAAIEA